MENSLLSILRPKNMDSVQAISSPPEAPIEGRNSNLLKHLGAKFSKIGEVKVVSFCFLSMGSRNHVA